MEHAGIHHAPPPRTLGPRTKLPLGCSRGPGCPTSVGNQSSAAAEAQLESAAPLTCSSCQRRWGGRKHLKSKSICKQEHASQAPGKPAPFPSPGPGPRQQLRPAGKSSGAASRGSEALRMENKPAVCTFWVCLVQYKWNRVGCSDTASTSQISGRR